MPDARQTVLVDGIAITRPPSSAAPTPRLPARRALRTEFDAGGRQPDPRCRGDREIRRKGYTLREDAWGGELTTGKAKAISHQLYKGNDYWFGMGCAVAGSTVRVRSVRQRRQPRRHQLLAARGQRRFVRRRRDPVPAHRHVFRRRVAGESPRGPRALGRGVRLPLTGRPRASSASSRRAVWPWPLRCSYSLLSIDGPAMSSTNSSWDLRIGGFSLVGVRFRRRFVLGRDFVHRYNDSFADARVWRPMFARENEVGDSTRPDCALLVIDVQERLVPAMTDGGVRQTAWPTR